MLHTMRFPLPWGWCEADFGPRSLVVVGDRRVPRKVHAHFAGVDGQPSLDLALEIIDGVPQCREVRIASVDGGREVKPLDLAAVKLCQWVEDVYANIAAMADAPADSNVIKIGDGTDKVFMDAARQMHAARKGRGARLLTPQFLAKVAEVYRQHISRTPTQSVAAAFGVSPRTASLYVKRAELAGLLPATTPGKKRS